MSRCNKCHNADAVYSRRYSGENLCKDCFSDSIIRKTAKTISKYNMIKHNDLVCVAVSGGKDSLALLYILDKMRKKHSFRIKAVTIDEGIPQYREEALGIVRDFCEKLGVEHTVYSYKELYSLTLEDALDIENQKHSEKPYSALSSCSICGTFRRRAIDHAAKEAGATVTATAHNLDDTLQTFLINALSGDTKKIGWMDPDSGDRSNCTKKIKPFCEIYESEIVFFAFTNDIPFQTEPCPHMNEGIRTEIRQFLNSLEGQHTGIKNNLYQSIRKISQSVSAQSNTRRKNTCPSCGSECTGKICSVCSLLQRFDIGH